MHYDYYSNIKHQNITEYFLSFFSLKFKSIFVQYNVSLNISSLFVLFFAVTIFCDINKNNNLTFSFRNRIKVLYIAGELQQK